MKNRQFIVMMVCFVICWYYFLASKLTESLNRDDFERNLWCASLTVEYEKFLKEKYEYVDNWYSQVISDVNVFYSKAIKDCVATYEITNREPDWTRYHDYTIENYFSKNRLFSCDSTEDKTWLSNTDCYSKREDWKLSLEPWYRTQYFYIEQ